MGVKSSFGLIQIVIECGLIIDQVAREKRQTPFYSIIIKSILVAVDMNPEDGSFMI